MHHAGADGANGDHAGKVCGEPRSGEQKLERPHHDPPVNRYAHAASEEETAAYSLPFRTCLWITSTAARSLSCAISIAIGLRGTISGTHKAPRLNPSCVRSGMPA